jgi:endonuclease G
MCRDSAVVTGNVSLFIGQKSIRRYTPAQVTRRRSRTFSSTFLVLLGLAVFVLVVQGVASRAALGGASANAIAASPHVVLGLPVDVDPRDDLLLDEREYVVSYNPEKLAPNWCAWRLDRSYLGHARRRDDFRVDDSLPLQVYRVTPHDYLHSGYDRGHLCPSADRGASSDMNSTTFLMTNVVPQLHELNAGPWEKLEEYERSLALDPSADVQLLAGPVFGPNPSTIGNGVAVPSGTWKIIAVLRSGQTALDVTDATEVVAVMMPNDPDVVRHPWSDYVTSVDEIEKQTGYDFLAAVGDDIEGAIEARTPRVR